MVVSPNLLDLTITGLYKNVLGIVESLSFTLEENATWQNFDSNMEGNSSKNEIYPSVINVSVGMKIIENHKVDKGTVTKYKYDFDGYTDTKNYNKRYIETTKETK
jgi:ABC-type antimicrobial peptide transport system ATPase subunit